MLQEEEDRWSPGMTDYANENTEKFIQDKDVRQAILLKSQKHKQPGPSKETGCVLVELLKQKKRL